MGWTFYNSSGEQLIYDAASAIEQATQAEAEAESNVDKYIPPDLIKNSPGVAKGWCRITAGGALVSGDYNTASITDTGTGDRTIVWDTDFADVNYSVVTTNAGGDTHNHTLNLSFAVDTVRLVTTNGSAAFTDYATSSAGFGDQ